LWALVEAGATQGQRKQECKIHRQTSKHCPFHRYIRDKFLVLLPFLCFCCWNMPKPPSITFQRLIPQQMKAGPPTAHFFWKSVCFQIVLRSMPALSLQNMSVLFKPR
jgi:hypothetical protein